MIGTILRSPDSTVDIELFNWTALARPQGTRIRLRTSLSHTETEENTRVAGIHMRPTKGDDHMTLPNQYTRAHTAHSLYHHGARYPSTKCREVAKLHTTLVLQRTPILKAVARNETVEQFS